MDLTSIAAAVVAHEPGAVQNFMEQAQGCSHDELSAAALVLSASPDLEINDLLASLLFHIGACEALTPLVERVAEALERGDDSWESILLVPLQDEDVRAGLPHRDRLLRATSSDTFLYGLLSVIDLEPLLVLHTPTRTGFEVTIGGIGDNFQLHTLLAYRLIPAHIPGEPLRQSWVEAASVGEDLQPPGGIHGQFELTDALGDKIWNEGRPADIPLHEGRRIVVLSPLTYQRSWNTGRIYPLMTPMVDVTGVLSSDEASAWLSKLGV
ncbi:hypothetical protein ACFWNN_14535 [Lentzea sp. NPDC058450]|uniref:hypothetical protein n=1 Tax=Lentzea sp. NPDC058450 TaxID=3346505 RepID=UPI0036479FA3